MNGVWTRVKGPILGLLLLLSVCPLLSDNSKAESEVKCAKSLFKESSFQPNSVSSSNSFPEGDRGNPSTDLSKWREHISVVNEMHKECGKYNLSQVCQAQGNSFCFHLFFY